jgi:hypothetical protein
MESMVCPACGSAGLRRSHRRGPLERALGLFRLYPYRCEKCKGRSWHFGRPAQVPDRRTDRRPGPSLDSRAIASAWRRRRIEVLLYVLGLGVFGVFLYFITRERTGSPE